MLKMILIDWMIHEKTALMTEAPVSLIVGPNGSGKTAFRDALEFLYLGTGQLRGIGTKKELAALAIRDGAKFCRVSLETDSVRLSRTMKPDGSQKLVRNQRSTGNEGWTEDEEIPMRRDGRSQIGNVAADALRAILEPTAFYTLPAERRREMLVQATTDEAATEAGVIEALEQALQVESDADREAIGSAARWVGEQGFRYAEVQAVEARKRAKRDRDALALEPPAIPDVAPEILQGLESHTLDDFQQRLEEVRQLHTAAVAAEASSVATIEGRLAEAQAAQKAAEDAEYEKADREAASVLKAATAAATDATKRLETANAAVTEASAAAKALEAPEAPQADFERPTTCPAVKFEMKCPVKTETFLKRRPAAPAGKDREKASQSAQKALKAALAEQQAATQDMQAARDAVQHAETRVESERNRQAREDAQVEAINAARARTQEIEGELLEARKLEANSEGQSAAELADRVDRGVELVRLKADFDTARAAHERAVAAKAELDAAVERWDEIAQALKPDGIESKMGGGARQRFVELIDQAAELTGGITLTEGFEMECREHGLHPLQLSTSQRLAVGIAIQHAMAQLVDFPILCCDAIDLFDPDQRAAWARFAQTVSPGYAGAVLGLATLGLETPAPPPPGFETFWLRDGAIEHLRSE